MKKIMVIVLASTLGSYGYAQSGNYHSLKVYPPIVKKNKSKRPPPPPPVPPVPPAIVEEALLPPPPPAPPVPQIIEESEIMAPPAPPPPPPAPLKNGSKKITKTKNQRDINEY